jgi:hypothetical protein
MEIKISLELVNKIVGYLASRPYQEVYQLIDGIKEAAKPKDESQEQGNGG